MLRGDDHDSGVDAAHIGGSAGELEGARITRDDMMDEIDLSERLLDLLWPGQVGIDLHRPELPADHPPRSDAMSVL